MNTDNLYHNFFNVNIRCFYRETFDFKYYKPQNLENKSVGVVYKEHTGMYPKTEEHKFSEIHKESQKL